MVDILVCIQLDYFCLRLSQNIVVWVCFVLFIKFKKKIFFFYYCWKQGGLFEVNKGQGQGEGIDEQKNGKEEDICYVVDFVFSIFYVVVVYCVCVVRKGSLVDGYVGQICVCVVDDVRCG